MTAIEETNRKYNFKEIESKWQKIWNDTKLYKTQELTEDKKKWYQLEMFAYPSGDIHMGHFRNYIIGDAVARQKMMQGYSVLHPFGWDAFGLPAERAAIKRNIHPDDWTKSNIKVSRSTLQGVGILFDWDREITSCNPDYTNGHNGCLFNYIIEGWLIEKGGSLTGVRKIKLFSQTSRLSTVNANDAARWLNKKIRSNGTLKLPIMLIVL